MTSRTSKKSNTAYDPNSLENVPRRSARPSSVSAARAISSEETQTSIAEPNLPDESQPEQEISADEQEDQTHTEDDTDDLAEHIPSPSSRTTNGLENAVPYPHGGVRKNYPRRVIQVQKQYTSFNRQPDKDDTEPPTWDDFLQDDGELDLKLLATCRSQIIDESRLQPSCPSILPISSSDFYDLKIKQDSVESAYASQIESISKTLVALTRVWGPSTESGALLQAHEQLKILTMALAVPYSERESFLMKNGAQTSVFRSSLLKEVASARKSAQKSSLRRRLSPNSRNSSSAFRPYSNHVRFESGRGSSSSYRGNRPFRSQSTFIPQTSSSSQ
jgi:hypothetical protein